MREDGFRCCSGRDSRFPEAFLLIPIFSGRSAGAFLDVRRFRERLFLNIYVLFYEMIIIISLIKYLLRFCLNDIFYENLNGGCHGV